MALGLCYSSRNASKAGACDMDETRITKENAIDLCKNESTAGDWQKCLEKICDLLEVGALEDRVDCNSCAMVQYVYAMYVYRFSRR